MIVDVKFDFHPIILEIGDSKVHADRANGSVSLFADEHEECCIDTACNLTSVGMIYSDSEIICLKSAEVKANYFSNSATLTVDLQEPLVI